MPSNRPFTSAVRPVKDSSIIATVGDGRLTQANHPPGNPGRFSYLHVIWKSCVTDYLLFYLFVPCLCQDSPSPQGFCRKFCRGVHGELFPGTDYLSAAGHVV